MNCMSNICDSLKQIDISSFSTSEVIEKKSMFEVYSKLGELCTPLTFSTEKLLQFVYVQEFL